MKISWYPIFEVTEDVMSSFMKFRSKLAISSFGGQWGNCCKLAIIGWVLPYHFRHWFGNESLKKELSELLKNSAPLHMLMSDERYWSELIDIFMYIGHTEKNVNWSVKELQSTNDWWFIMILSSPSLAVFSAKVDCVRNENPPKNWS